MTQEAEVEIRDARFTRVVGSVVQLKRLATGFQFTEGPVWHPHERFLVFSDIAGNRMYRWTETDGVVPLRTPSNMANGNAYDQRGRLLTCEHATSRVVRAELDGHLTVLASHYGDKELNSPNDLVVKRDGFVYFTDPAAGRRPFYGVPRDQELAFQGVYRLDPENAALTLLVDDFALPNGLCFSLDERQLFVNDTERHHIRVFALRPDGTLADGRTWAVTLDREPGRPDGMKLDREGNLYCAAGIGGLYVFDPDATCLGVIRFPEKAANCAWGGDDLRTLFVTASSSLYTIRVAVPGRAAF